MNEGLNIITLKAELVHVDRKELAVRIGDYGFLISKGRKTYTITIVKREGLDANIIITDRMDRIKEKLKETGDQFLAENAEQIVEKLSEFLAAWKTLLLKQRALHLFFPTLYDSIYRGERIYVESSSLESSISSIYSGLNLYRFEDVVSLVSKKFNKKIAELLEILVTVSLTLRQIDRSKMVYKNRPLWLLVIGDPATYKTSSFDFLEASRYWHKLSYVTAASFLSAKKDVTPLIDLIHNKVLALPTLNEIASDKDSAARLFAALESIYDGFYSKATGLSGEQKRVVDTVVVAAITPMVWEKVLLPKVIMFGSRWLVYRFFLSDDEAFNIQETLDENRDLAAQITLAASRTLDMLLETVTPEILDNVFISDKQKEELKIMAKLVSRLRAGWERIIYWYEDEAGKKHAEEEIVVLQREAPGRAYQQLKNFVRANSIVRQASVEKIVGIPKVDDHAMKLAFNLALGASHSALTKLVVFLTLIPESELDQLSQREIAKKIGISQTQVHRFLKVLEHPRIALIESTAYPLVKEPYRTIIRKYLIG